MGKRGRVQKKYRQKYSFQLTMPDSTNEKTHSEPEYAVQVITPTLSDHSDSKESIDHSQDCTPEFVLLESKKMGYYNDMSPKMNTRLTKFKLDLDIPENDDMDIVEDEKNKAIRDKDDFGSSKDLEKTLSVEQIFESENEESISGSILKANDFTKGFSLNFKTNSELVNVPRKELTSLSGYFQIPSSTFNLPILDETSSPNHFCARKPMQSDSKIDNGCFDNPVHYNDGNNLIKIRHSNIGDDCLLSDRNRSFFQNCCMKINNDEKLGNTSPKIILNISDDKSWDPTLENTACINLPVVSDVDSKTLGTESYMTVLNNASDAAFLTSDTKSYMLLKRLKTSFVKIKTYCTRLAGKCIVWIKKGCKSVKNLLSVIITASNSTPLVNSELTQVIAVVRYENERILSVLSEKICSLSQELIEVRMSSETNLQAFKDEINKAQISSIQLTKNTDNLVKELKTWQAIVQETKSTSLLELPAVRKDSIVPTLLVPLCASTLGVSAPPSPPLPPPPPPLPPPPPPPMMFISKLNTNSITPKNRFDNNTPVKKCSTPLTIRPTITVEDLLKVTLKKAPQNFKPMENRRNTVPGLRGPVISLDMLRNVKLKSARRRSLDQHKSPRSMPRLTRNRSQINVNLSPRASHIESSLSRLLKPADANKRVFKKTQFVSSSSENDLSRNRPPVMLAVPFCHSESTVN